MKKNLYLFAFAVCLFSTFHTQAKVWRINNTPGLSADFSSGSLAIASSSVVNDESGIEPFPKTYIIAIVILSILIIFLLGFAYFPRKK